MIVVLPVPPAPIKRQACAYLCVWQKTVIPWTDWKHVCLQAYRASVAHIKHASVLPHLSPDHINQASVMKTQRETANSAASCCACIGQPRQQAVDESKGCNASPYSYVFDKEQSYHEQTEYTTCACKHAEPVSLTSNMHQCCHTVPQTTWIQTLSWRHSAKQQTPPPRAVQHKKSFTNGNPDSATMCRWTETHT